MDEGPLAGNACCGGVRYGCSIHGAFASIGTVAMHCDSRYYSRWDRGAVPVPQALDDLASVVDDVVLVEDEAIVEAMRMIFDLHGLVLEPAGGCRRRSGDGVP